MYQFLFLMLTKTQVLGLGFLGATSKPLLRYNLQYIPLITIHPRHSPFCGGDFCLWKNTFTQVMHVINVFVVK